MIVRSICRIGAPASYRMKAKVISRPARARRSGVVAVESAIVYPAFLFILLALIIGGMGIFRYNQVASLTRDASRYASTHGADFRRDRNLPRGTAQTWSQDIIDNAVAPSLVSLDTNLLSVVVSWPDVPTMPGQPDNRPGSTVTVTVSYQWFPELYLAGPIVLTSTSTVPITH